MSDDESGGPIGWKPIPGDQAIVSRTAQTFNPISAASSLPRSSREEVLKGILLPGEEVVASVHSPRVTFGLSDTPAHALDTGMVMRLLLTRSSFLAFAEFAHGLPAGEGGLVVAPLGWQYERQYCKLPLADIASVTPYAKAQFTITWTTGVHFTVHAKQLAAPPIYRRRPLKRFYKSLNHLIGKTPGS